MEGRHTGTYSEDWTDTEFSPHNYRGLSIPSTLLGYTIRESGLGSCIIHELTTRKVVEKWSRAGTL